MRRLFCCIALWGLAGGICVADPLTPPIGTSLLFSADAEGVQIYACLPKDPTKPDAFEWVFSAPQADLFDARQIGTHSKGPSWVWADGSKVMGELVAKQDSPDKGSIPWLLLRVTSHEGQGKLAAAGAIRRIDTKGGSAPDGGCDGSHVGEIARIRYSATYQFFGL
jgi:hypothetical protein